MGIFDRVRKQMGYTKAEEQADVFRGMNGALVPDASADGDDGAVGDVQSVHTPEVTTGAGVQEQRGGRGLSISSKSGTPFNAVFPNSLVSPNSPENPNAVPPVDASLQGNPVEPVLAAPAATSPTEVGTSSSAEGNAVTGSANASHGNVNNDVATVTQGEGMNNSGSPENGGQVSVARKVVSDDLSGMSDADLASRIEKIEQGRDRLKKKGMTDEQIDAILGDLHGELDGRKAKGLEGNEKPKNGDAMPTKKRDDGKAEGDTKTTTTTTSTTTNTTNTTTDTGAKDKDAGGEVNAEAVKKALDNPQTAEDRVKKEITAQSTKDLSKGDNNNSRSNLDDYSAKELDGLTDEQKEQIKNGSVLVIDKNGSKKVVEGTPTLNERQLAAEQNKPDAKPPKTQKQINDEIEALADIKEGDSDELKKLKRERARLSYEIENMPPFVPEEAVYPDMPKKVKTDVNYKRVLERIEKERKDRGDDPETKAKREKAHKANLVVASISDLLSGAINLWGAAHGAKSLDLKSGVAKLEKKHKDQIDEGLKIAEQETKELEKAMKEDRDFDKAVNDAALAEYKEVLKQLREAVRARNTAGQKQWDAKRAELQKRLESANRRVEEQTKYEHRWYLNNQTHSQRSSEIAQRGNEQRKTKQTRGAGSTVTHVSNGGGAGAGSGSGAPAQ